MKIIFYICGILVAATAWAEESLTNIVPEHTCVAKQSWQYITYYEGDTCPSGTYAMYSINRFCEDNILPCGMGINFDSESSTVYTGQDTLGLFTIDGFCPY